MLLRVKRPSLQRHENAEKHEACNGHDEKHRNDENEDEKNAH